MWRPVLVVAASFACFACDAPQKETAGAVFEPASSPLPQLLDDLRPLREAEHDARRDALIRLLHANGFSPREHEFPDGRNLIVSVGSGDPAIVAGAHYDATHHGEGMVDNAAGVLVVLRAAAALRELPLSRRIDFVFFDREEVGLVGSRHYASSLAAGSVAAMVNVDVAAYGDTVFYGHTTHGHTTLYDAITDVCAAQRQACIGFDRYPPSDDRSFQAAGIPNVSLSVLPRAEVHQLWLLMNGGEASGLADGFYPGVFHTIHTEYDTLDAVEPAAMTTAYNVLTALLWELAR